MAHLHDLQLLSLSTVDSGCVDPDGVGSEDVGG